jgi:hypothetical protein
MKNDKMLLLIDSMINLFLGLVLLLYSEPVIDFFGLPLTNNKFYPTILGAVLFGIGVALIIEYVKKPNIVGLGLGGAISINLIGGIVLLIWLIWGTLTAPTHGLIILWVLAILLVSISLFEILNVRKTNK